jgi:hypothetical protein
MDATQAAAAANKLLRDGESLGRSTWINQVYQFPVYDAQNRATAKIQVDTNGHATREETKR